MTDSHIQVKGKRCKSIHNSSDSLFLTISVLSFVSRCSHFELYIAMFHLFFAGGRGG